jgi:hypothetical protein
MGEFSGWSGAVSSLGIPDRRAAEGALNGVCGCEEGGSFPEPPSHKGRRFAAKVGRAADQRGHAARLRQ